MERIEDRRAYWEVRREQLEKKLAGTVLMIAAFDERESGQLELDYDD